MAAIRGRNNQSTEEVLASLLRRNGLWGWRRHLPLPGRPDFAFTRQKVAVFIDGCFWHGCPLHYTQPATNRAFWRRKIEGNMRRDRTTAAQLRRKGWRVLRIWEHSLKEPGRVLARITRALAAADGSSP